MKDAMSFTQMLVELHQVDRHERAAARAGYAAEVRGAGKPSPALLKSLQTLIKIHRDQASVLRESHAPDEVARPVLGALIKSAVADAVASGRLSGTSAVAGLPALELENWS